MYLPTAFLDCTEGYEWLWFDRFTYAFRHSPLNHVEVPALAPGEPHTSVRLDSAGSGTAACAPILAAAHWLSRLDRDAYCDCVADALRIRIPEAPSEEFGVDCRRSRLRLSIVQQRAVLSSLQGLAERAHCGRSQLTDGTFFATLIALVIISPIASSPSRAF
jgi:hypothetical protein